MAQADFGCARLRADLRGGSLFSLKPFRGSSFVTAAFRVAWRMNHAGRAGWRLSAVVIIASILMSVRTDAADEPVCSLERNPKGFDQRALTLHGTIVELNETTSQRGNNYTTFKLQDQAGARSKFLCGSIPN